MKWIAKTVWPVLMVLAIWATWNVAKTHERNSHHPLIGHEIEAEGYHLMIRSVAEYSDGEWVIDATVVGEGG